MLGIASHAGLVYFCMMSMTVAAGMSSEDLTRGLLYLSLTVVGVPGNAAVVLALLLLHRQSRLLPPDAILLHLACSNLLVVGVRCLLVTVASFGAEGIFGDASCKAVVFTYRTFRAFSIWLTLVLSAYQCLSVAPPGSRWLSVRAAAARYLGLVFLFLWVFNICMSLESILFCVAKHNDSSQISNGYNLQFCYLLFPSKLSKDVNTGAQVTRDAVPMALMTVTSVIILLFLYKNSQRVKGLRGGGTGGGAAEQRAAKSVVALVTLYVVFYGVDSGLTVYMLTLRRTMSSSLVTDLRVFFSTLYAAVSPLLIIASNRKVSGSLRCAAHRKWAQESPPRA